MIASPSSMMRSPADIRSATTSETAERQNGTLPVPSRPLSPSCDLDLDPVWVWEVHPVPLPSGLQTGRFQFLFGPIGIVTLDGVAVMVQTGSLALEQRQEEVVAAAQEAVVLATVPDDLQPQVLDVEVSGPGHATDIQGDVIQTRGLKGAAFALAYLGHMGHHAQGRPESHQSGSELAAGQQAPLEVLNERFGDVGLHDQPLLSGRGSGWISSGCNEHVHRPRASHKGFTIARDMPSGGMQSLFIPRTWHHVVPGCTQS